MIPHSSPDAYLVSIDYTNIDILHLVVYQFYINNFIINWIVLYHQM